MVEGTEYLVSGIHKSEYRGSLVEIATNPPADGKLKMTIKGTDIPVVKEIDGQQIFAFIMPYGDVSITIEKAEKSDDPSNWRIARSGCTVVMTNLEIAQKIIPLKFK